MKRISRKKLEKFGVKHFVPKKGLAKYAVDALDGTKVFKIYYKFNFWAKLLTIILFPVNILIAGIGNFSEIKDEFKTIWNLKKEWYLQDNVWSESSALYKCLNEWYWGTKE